MKNEGPEWAEETIENGDGADCSDSRSTRTLFAVFLTRAEVISVEKVEFYYKTKRYSTPSLA